MYQKNPEDWVTVTKRPHQETRSKTDASRKALTFREDIFYAGIDRASQAVNKASKDSVSQVCPTTSVFYAANTSFLSKMGSGHRSGSTPKSCMARHP